MVKKKVSKKKANKSSNNFNRNLLIGAVIIILIFVVAFNFAGEGSDEEGLAQMGLGDGDSGNLKPFKDIKDFYDICPLYKVFPLYEIPNFDCDDFTAWAAACAITMGYNVCAVYIPGIHINNIIEVESGRSNKRKFCVVNPQNQNGVVTSPGCSTGCWFQDLAETEPLKSKAGNCVASNQEIWCNLQEIINFTRDRPTPSTSLCDVHYCKVLGDNGICVEEILELIEEKWPGWDPRTGHTFSSGGGSQPTRTRIGRGRGRGRGR